MVYESREWKTAIKRNNRYLNNKLLLDNIDEVDGLSDRLQIKLSTNALLCRRLFESQKVASQLKDKKIPVVFYPCNGKIIHKNNWLFAERNYQFNNPIESELSASYLCNQIIHSFVWIWLYENKKLTHFSINSDQTRHKKIYQINIDNFINYCHELSNSWPSRGFGKFNKETQDFEYYWE